MPEPPAALSGGGGGGGGAECFPNDKVFREKTEFETKR